MLKYADSFVNFDVDNSISILYPLLASYMTYMIEKQFI